MHPYSGCEAAEDQSEAETLAYVKDVFKNDFLVGNALNEDMASGKDSISRTIILEQFNAITPENVMKAERINPEPGVYNFKPADDFVAFGKQHDLFIIGHTLIWHNQTPDWFFKYDNGNPKNKEAQIEQMRRHIETIAGRYAGKVDAWDVVNEVIDNDGSYRPTTWVNGVGNGDTLVKNAFKFTERYAPNTELYYNDFNAWRPTKRDGIMRMIRMLQKEGVRVDGVGIQATLGTQLSKNRVH